MRMCNAQGENLIKQFEGCKLTGYLDVGGIWTIGYGHTGTAAQPTTIGSDTAVACISQADADHLLNNDLLDTEEHLDRVLPQFVRGNAFSALCCLVYNIGKGNFDSSTLKRCLDNNDTAGAAEEFLKWDHVKGVVVSGLLARRAAERALFLQEDIQ